VSNGRTGNVASKTIELLFAEWLVDKEAEVSGETLAFYTDLVSRVFLPFFEASDILTTAAVDDYVRHRLRKVRRDTVVRELTALRSFVRWADRRKYLPEPVDIQDPPRHALGTPVLENVTVQLSAEECEALIAALPDQTRYGHRVKALFTVIWETSLRIGTMSRLRVPEHYRKGATELRLTADVDKARYARRIPLTARSRALLDEACPNEGLLFGTYDYRRTLRAAAKKAGISEERRKHLSAHDIRHAAVTHAQEVSQNIAGAAYMAGHRRTATTAAYTHPGFAAGLAIQGARFGFRHTKRHTDGSRGNSEAQNPLVGTGGIEPPTPTVSRFSRG
jgi:site-specific recombinase XerC